jgi:hypothetical protein
MGERVLLDRRSERPKLPRPESRGLSTRQRLRRKKQRLGAPTPPGVPPFGAARVDASRCGP